MVLLFRISMLLLFGLLSYATFSMYMQNLGADVFIKIYC